MYKTLNNIRIIFLSIAVLWVDVLHASAVTPSRLIDSFYTSRRFMHFEALETLAGGELSRAGKDIAAEALYDYSIIEISIVSRNRAYSEIEVRSRSVRRGIQARREFWKMSCIDGRWIIDNIYTPKEWQIKKACRPGSSLADRVEAIAAFRFEYEVVDEPKGPPMIRCLAYIRRRDFKKAFYWSDVAVRQTHRAEAYFYRGLLNAYFKRNSEAKRDISAAIRADRRYYYILQNLIAASRKKGGKANQGAERSTRIIQGYVRSMFAR